MKLKEIWAILVEKAGANEDGESAFVNQAGETLKEHGRIEYRFMGCLGFGGKVWIGNQEAPYVTCYPEDLTDAREQVIDETNKALRNLMGIRETSGPVLQALGSVRSQFGQVTKCALGEEVFFVREAMVGGTQKLELATSNPRWQTIANAVRVEDSLYREVVLNPEWTVSEAEKLFAR